MAFKTGESIIKTQGDFMKHSLIFLRDTIKRCTTVDDMLSAFDESTFEITRSMELLNTHQKLRTAVKHRGLLEEPSLFTVKENVIQLLGEFEEERSTGCIMPIEHQIRNFLECPGILESMLETQNTSNREGNYGNVVDGSIWREIISSNNMSDPNSVIIPIHFYNDDFNIDNPISPHSGETKLTAYYYHFPTLPDYITTNVDNIFLAMLHKSKDVNKKDVYSHGIDPALLALWDTFKNFEKDGLELKIDKRTVRVRVIFLQMYGDNLGLNSCLGFSRGFSGNFSCRICTVHINDMKTMTEAQHHLIRNENNYKECLEATSNEDKKGVMYECVLNRFLYFKVFKHFGVDIMHDAFLGVLKYDLICVLEHYIIRTKTFTLRQFNNAKNKFDYGPKNKGDKICDIADAHLTSRSLHMNAKEVWTLVELLPLILSTLVPNRNTRHFKFVLKMAELLFVITRKDYSEEQLQMMDRVIKEHHRMYLSYFPDSHLVPKFHLMLHYSMIVRLSGPLRNSMVFRFESKHQQLKEYARCCFSRVNISLSICRKFCIEFAYILTQYKEMLTKIKDVVFKGGIEFPTSEANCVFSKSARFKGTLFAIGDIITKEDQHFKIVGIAVKSKENRVIVRGELLSTTTVSTLGCLKIIRSLGIFEEIDLSSIRSSPVNVHLVDGFQYIIFKN